MYEEASLEDLSTLLMNSVIMYKKLPIMIQGISLNRELHASYIGQKGTEEIPLNSPDLDFKPVPLGMCNHSGHAHYLSRKPGRQWSQGLTSKNINISFLNKEKTGDSWMNLLNLKNKSIHSCILGEYPSIENCIVALDKPDMLEMAFSREFAINKNLLLYYRSESVGMIDSDNGKIIFEKHKKFLKEILNART